MVQIFRRASASTSPGGCIYLKTDQMVDSAEVDQGGAWAMQVLDDRGRARGDSNYENGRIYIGSDEDGEYVNVKLSGGLNYLGWTYDFIAWP